MAANLTSQTSFVQARLSGASTSTCTDYSDFNAIASHLDYVSGKDVYKSINVSEAMQCFPTKGPACLTDSFTMDFMSNYASLVNVCKYSNRKLTEVVSHLDDAVTSLNASIYEKVSDSGVIASWNIFYASYRDSVAILTKNAPSADQDLETPAVHDIIDSSCTYPDTNDKMEATCAGFVTAQEYTSAIQKLNYTQQDIRWGWLSLYEVVDWDMGVNYMGTFCNNDSYYYQSNTIRSCEVNQWESYGEVVLDGGCEDYGWFSCEDYGC